MFSTATIAPAMAAAGDAAARDYLVQKVCVDLAGKVRSIDPYDCASPDHLRPIAIGEPLPYYKHDQPRADKAMGLLRHDAYPVRDLAGEEIIASPFIFEPMDRFEPGAHDGYDIFLIRDGWAEIGETKVGFAATFFSAGCKTFGGWVLFPTNIFDSVEPKNGRAYVPISSNYWEQNGENWPGSCPPHYAADSLTTWDFIEHFPFGGIGGNRAKTLDTIRSIHGFQSNATFMAGGHLEVFYFTKLYGITRWEVWRALTNTPKDADLRQQGDHTRPSCSGDPEITYEQTAFIRTNCRDWSAVTLQDPPVQPPPWPIPALNLLSNFHFGDGGSGWILTGKSAEGAGPNGRALNSSLPTDRKFIQPGGKGLAYLAVDCGGTCADGEMLYQDIPVSRGLANGSYYAGLTARYEDGQVSGTMAITVAQVDQAGNILDGTRQEVVTAAIPAANRFPQQEQSLARAATAIGHDVSLTLRPETKALRVIFSPQSKGVFELFDAWFFAYPAQ